jgi:hypothetical protein
VRRDESVGAVLAAGDARDHEIAGGQRRRRSRIVLAPVGERGVPEERARPPVQRNHVRIVGFHEHAIAGHGDAAVRVSLLGALGARALELPDPASAAGVERDALVRSGHVHDAVDDRRRALQSTRVGHVEHPSRRETRDVALVDLRERGEAVAARLAVVARPSGLRRHLADTVSLTAQ